MTKQTGLGDRFFLDGFNLSGDIGALQSIGMSRALLDVTGIDKSAHERLPGLGDSEISFNAWFNPSVGQSHRQLRDIPDNRHVMYWRGSTQGVPVAAMVGTQANYNVVRGADGSLAISAQVMNKSGDLLDWGQALTTGPQISTGPEELALVSDPRYEAGSLGDMVAYLQVLALTGDDVIFRLRHSDYAADTLPADDDLLVALTNLLTNNVFTLAGPIVGDARILTITVVDTTPSITAGTVRITGTDAYGAALIENVSIAGGAGVYETTDRFKTVTEVRTLNDVVTLGGAGDETIKVGVKAVSGAFGDITGGEFTMVEAAPAKERIEINGPIKPYVWVEVDEDMGFTTVTYAIAVKRFGPRAPAQ